MSNLVVITFDNEDEAAQVRETLRSVQRENLVNLDDSAIVVKDREGKVHVKDEMDRGVKAGALGGGVLGLLIGSIFFPLGGMVLGALAGALVGRSVDLGIQHEFVEQVADDLKPGTSALFILVRDANPNVALAALKPYKGQVYHTSLAPDAEEELRRILKKRM